MPLSESTKKASSEAGEQKPGKKVDERDKKAVDKPG